MKSKTISKLALLGAITISLGIAHAAYTTYNEAADAAFAQLQAGNYADAQKTSQEALALAKTPSEKEWSLARLATIAQAQKQPARARELWTKLLRVPEVSAGGKGNAQFGIGLSYVEEKDWERARVEFEKVLAIPEARIESKSAARYSIAIALGEQGKESESRAAFSSLAEDVALDAGTRANAYGEIGFSLISDKKFEEARAAFRQAQALKELSSVMVVRIQASIAKTYRLEGNTDRAKVEEGEAQVLGFQRFEVLRDAKQFTAAREVMEAVLASTTVPPPLDAMVRMQIGQLFLDESKPAEARKVFEVVLAQKEDESLSPQQRKIWVYRRQSALLSIARSYVQEGNKAQAQKILKSLLDMPQLHPNVAAAAGLLLKEVS